MNALETTYNVVAEPLKALGFTVTLETDPRDRILITHPDAFTFEGTIYEGGYRSEGKCRLSFSNDYRYVLKDVNRPDKYRSESDTYTIGHYASKELKETHSFLRESYPTSYLSKEFKYNKNPKLVLNDVLTPCKLWLEVCLSASPVIAKRRAERARTAELCTMLRHAAGYHDGYTYLLPPDHKKSYTIEGKGEVTIDYWGSITITKPLTEEELLELIK